MGEKDISKSKPDANLNGSDAGENNSSVFAEVWQSAKYSLVQESYDAARQVGKHLGVEMKERDLVAKPQEPKSAAQQLAYDVGSGIGKAPVFVGMYALTRLGAGRTAASMSLLPTADASIARLSIAGAATAGLAKPTEDKNFWQERATNALVGGTAMYAFGKLQSRILEAGGLLEPRLSADLASNLAYRAKIGGAGVIAGSGAGFTGAETRSLVQDHKLASASDLSRAITSSAVLGATAGLLKEPTPLGYRWAGLKASRPTDSPPQIPPPAEHMYVPKFEPARIVAPKPRIGEDK